MFDSSSSDWCEPPSPAAAGLLRPGAGKTRRPVTRPPTAPTDLRPRRCCLSVRHRTSRDQGEDPGDDARPGRRRHPPTSVPVVAALRSGIEPAGTRERVSEVLRRAGRRPCPPTSDPSLLPFGPAPNQPRPRGESWRRPATRPPAPPTDSRPALAALRSGTDPAGSEDVDAPTAPVVGRRLQIVGQPNSTGRGPAPRRATALPRRELVDSPCQAGQSALTTTYSSWEVPIPHVNMVNQPEPRPPPELGSQTHGVGADAAGAGSPGQLAPKAGFSLARKARTPSAKSGPP